MFCLLSMNQFNNFSEALKYDHHQGVFDRDLEVVCCVKCENLNDCVLYESSVCIIVDSTCYLNVDY